MFVVLILKMGQQAFPDDFSRDAFFFGLRFIAGDAASSLAGHTGRTQGKSYSSFDQLDSREVIRMSHAALGKNSTLHWAQNAPLPIITEQKIWHSMDDVLGCKSNYTCPKSCCRFGASEWSFLTCARISLICASFSSLAPPHSTA